MRHAIALFAIVCGALLIFGGLIEPAEDRMRVTASNSKRLLTVALYLPDVSERYRWVSVHGCSADVGENGVFCNGFFERESSMEIIDRRKQYLFDWRDLPRGTMLITAVTFDVERKPLARGSTVVFR